VEAERDDLDTEAVEPLERLWPYRGSAESGDVLDLACPQLMEVQEAFDQHDLAPLVGRSAKQLSETVGRQVRTARAPEVEVPHASGLGVVKRSCPEGGDPPIAVSPSAAEPTGPARVGEHAGLRDLARPVTAPLEHPARSGRSGDDAESRVGNRFAGESAALEVHLCGGTALARKLLAAEIEELLQQVCPTVARLGTVEH